MHGERVACRAEGWCISGADGDKPEECDVMVSGCNPEYLIPIPRKNKEGGGGRKRKEERGDI